MGSSKGLIYGGIGGGAAVAVAVIVLFVFHTNAPQYGLSLDASTDMQMGVGSTIRLYVTNTGASPLTNLKANYGATSDSIPEIDPGQKIMLSPPSGTKMVTVTTDQGATASKDLSSMG